MGVQRKSREVLLQLLFQADMNQSDETSAQPESMAKDPKSEHVKDPQIQKRASELFSKIVERKDEIDKSIEKISKNWKVSRMSAVDRNILRYATYELLYCDDVPGEVVLNEAVEIAKRFGSEHSSSFVNGILDKVFNSSRPS